MATKRAKGIKVPFELHLEVTATSQIALPKVTELELSPDTATLAAASGGHVVLVDSHGGRLDARGELAGAAAQYVTWSDDGARLATLDGEWSGEHQTAHMAVYSWPDGRRLAACDMPKWGYVTHAHTGTNAPMMAFSPDGGRLLIRSATMRDQNENALGVLDVASGAFHRQVLGAESYIFSIAVTTDRVLVLFGDARDDAGLIWLDAKTLEARGHLSSIAGEQVVMGAGGAWVIGDDTWVWRVDTQAIESGKATRGKKLTADVVHRWERHQQLTSRASARWDVDYLKGREPDKGSLHTTPEFGVRCFLHPEPWGIPQAARFGDDDVIVRDGVRVALWRTRASETLEVTPLIEDLQRATTSKARHMMMSARRPSAGSTRGRLVLGWRKALNAPETVVTFFDVREV